MCMIHCGLDVFIFFFFFPKHVAIIANIISDKNKIITFTLYIFKGLCYKRHKVEPRKLAGTAMGQVEDSEFAPHCFVTAEQCICTCICFVLYS